MTVGNGNSITRPIRFKSRDVSRVMVFSKMFKGETIKVGNVKWHLFLQVFQAIIIVIKKDTFETYVKQFPFDNIAKEQIGLSEIKE